METLSPASLTSDRPPDFWVVLWTKAIAEHGNKINGSYAGAFTAFGVLTLLCSFAPGLQILTKMVPQSAKTLHERLLQTIMSAPWHFFSSRHTGQTLNHFSQDLSIVDSELPISMLVCGPVCLAIIQLVLICVSAAYFTTIVPAIIGVLYILQNYYLHTSRQHVPTTPSTRTRGQVSTLHSFRRNLAGPYHHSCLQLAAVL